MGDAKVRFVHTVPGGDDVQLEATADGITQRVGRGVGFGEIGRYEDVPAGEVKFELLEANGRPITGTREDLQNGARYTVVGMSNKAPMVLRDGRAEGGTARIRVVQAAPELGAVDVMAADETVADGIAYGDVSAYTGLGPGAYSLRVTNPADSSTIASQGAVTLTAGTASTAFVVGTAGEPVGIVVSGDRTAAPRGAPATGLGGLADEDSHLLLALLAGLLAALGGAAAYVALTARRGGP